MSGKSHFQHLIHKGSVLIDILMSLSWGSHSHLLLNLYRSMFRESIEHGCQIFWFNRNKTIFTKFERLQYRAIRVAMGYYTSPINVMLYEAKEVPLKLRFSFLTHKFLIKSFAREVIDSLDLLKATTVYRAVRIRFFRSFPIFRHFISVQNICTNIYSSAFLSFSITLRLSYTTIQPCIDMFPTDSNLTPIAINKECLEKSFQYRIIRFLFIQTDLNWIKIVPLEWEFSSQT